MLDYDTAMGVNSNSCRNYGCTQAKGLYLDYLFGVLRYFPVLGSVVGAVAFEGVVAFLFAVTGVLV